MFDRRATLSWTRSVGPTLLLGLVACTSPAGSAQPSSASGPEQPTITVGVLPIVDVAPVHLALERGLFGKHGLDVRVELVQGGAAAIPALVSGDLQLTYGNWVSFLLANQEGIELRAVAAGVAAAPGFTELLAGPGSPLEGNPSGLAGATIAINTLNNIGELAVLSTLRQAGISPDQVRLVEIAFPDMGAALDRGDVDVIWASEPVPTTVKSQLGAVTVIDSFVGPMAGFPVAGYQATSGFVAANPRTVAAFNRALAEAVAIIDADQAAARAAILGSTSLPAEIVDALALPDYRATMDASTLARVRDYLVEFSMLKPGLDVDELVPAAAGSG